MNRKQLLIKYGVTKGIVQGLWSFVNPTKKMVIFGAWDYNTETHRAKILDESWMYKNNRRKAGYSTALKHIKLLEDGYKLYIFIQEPKPKTRPNASLGIGKVYDKLELCQIKKVKSTWYAYRDTVELNPDELDIDNHSDDYYEGSLKVIKVNTYERDKEAREKCIEKNGLICKGCGFDFEKVYGKHGKGFIHVHHKVPLSSIGKTYEVDPINDLVPLCPNCHAMVHRFKNELLDIEQLKELIRIAKK